MADKVTHFYGSRCTHNFTYCYHIIRSNVYLAYLEFGKWRRGTGNTGGSACKPADTTDAIVGDRLGAEVAANKHLRLGVASRPTHSTPKHVEFRAAMQRPTFSYASKTTTQVKVAAYLQGISAYLDRKYQRS